MADKPWKQAERRAATLIGGRRYPANLGAQVDVESSWAVCQVKEVKTCSLAALETLALEAERQGQQKTKLGMVVIKRRGGRGTKTPELVVMTASVFREMHGSLGGSLGGETADYSPHSSQDTGVRRASEVKT